MVMMRPHLFLLHVRDDLVCEIHGAHEIEVDGTAPLFDGGREKTLGGRASGVGHADIDAAELLDHGTDEIPDGVRIGDIEGFGQHFGLVSRADIFGDRGERFPVARADGETAAFGGESLGRGSAESLAGCGNDGDAILESGFHERRDYRVCAAGAVLIN